MAETQTQPQKQLQIKPQEGFQEAFLSSPADIVIGGGAAGAGKSWVLLLEPIRHTHVPGFGGVIFRRITPQITNEGGLWDTSMQLYPHAGGVPKESRLTWEFPKGPKLKFAHMEYETNKLDWQGTQVPYIGFDELTHFCVTPDTEVLTATGWKNITAIKVGERVASLGEDRSIRHEHVLGTPSFEYDGELLTANQRQGVSFRVTPNHRMVVNRQDKDDSWGFIRADHLAKTNQMIPRAGLWDGNEVEYINFDLLYGRGIGSNSNQVERINADDYLALLGWYLAEGSSFFSSRARQTSACVSIRQTKPNEALQSLMSRLPWRVRPDGEGGYRIFSKQLFEHLKPLGNRFQKRVPRWVFDLNPRQQRILLDAFLQGDGSLTVSGGWSLGLCNEGLVDDLQEMSFYCGLVATKGYSFVRGRFHVYRLTISLKRQQTQIQKGDVKSEPYKGKVHCLTVDGSGTFLMRHNGRVSWTGNSKTQFFYLVGRNRSVCGVKPYIRASCNPDPDSWVAEFIEWWIDQETGYPIPERAGKVRYFTVDKGHAVWGDTADEVIEKCPHIFNAAEFDGMDKRDLVKSVTFIPGTIYGNKELLSKNPEYLGNLLSLDEAEQMQLLRGNWKVRQDGSALFDYARVNDLFTNFVEASKDKYITVGYARFGQDLTVIITWSGWQVERIEVMTKSSTVEAFEAIERERARAKIPMSNVIVDDDGVGGGVVDQSRGQYKSFRGGLPASPNPLSARGDETRENYKDTKTQCYYRLAQKVNAAEVAIRLDNIVVDGVATDEIQLKGQLYQVRKLIAEDLRSVKKKDLDKDGKRQINPKEEQKNILGGRSPDFGDALMMRVEFDLAPPAAEVGFWVID